ADVNTRMKAPFLCDGVLSESETRCYVAVNGVNELYSQSIALENHAYNLAVDFLHIFPAAYGLIVIRGSVRAGLCYPLILGDDIARLVGFVSVTVNILFVDDFVAFVCFCGLLLSGRFLARKTGDSGFYGVCVLLSHILLHK